jgi:pyruvate-formate lyase-activating enzyme
MHCDSPSPEETPFPKMVVVSITNICDFACTHCYYPHYAKRPGYLRHTMEVGVFRRIADEMGAYPETALRFIAWGEPLLHPQAVELVHYARQAACRNPLTLITNGYWLTPDRSLALMDSGLDLVEISLDAATPETYRQVRASRHADAFSRVERNVREMVNRRNKSGFRTRIVVSYIVHPSVESVTEYGLFVEKWAGVADEIIKRPVHTFKGSVPAIAPLPSPRSPCHGLWARCNITPWGQASVCYNDWENRYILGDLRDPDATIASIWQGPTLTQLRAEQCRGTFTGMCAECRDYNPEAWNHPYEQVVSRCHRAVRQSRAP